MVGGVSGETKEVSGKTPLPRPAGKFFIPYLETSNLSYLGKVKLTPCVKHVKNYGYLPNLSPTKPPTTLRFSLFVQKYIFSIMMCCACCKVAI